MCDQANPAIPNEILDTDAGGLGRAIRANDPERAEDRRLALLAALNGPWVDTDQNDIRCVHRNANDDGWLGYV